MLRPPDSTPVRNYRSLAELAIRMAKADHHLAGLERYLFGLGRYAEATVVRNARDLLAGKCVRCREVHRQPPCPGFAE